MNTRAFLASPALAMLLAGCGTVVVAGDPQESSSSTSTGAPPAPCSGAECTWIVRISTGVPRCAVRKNGDAVCWGGPFPGGDGPNDDPPYAIPDLHDAVAAAGMNNQMCFLRASGHVACLGSNEHGEVGTVPLGESTSTPLDVPGVEGAVEVAAGLNFTCARLASGKVLCWGKADMLGAGPGQQSTPVAVVGLEDAASLSIGYRHACSGRKNGEVVCWGENYWDQLGDGTMMDQQIPVTTLGLTDAVEAVAGWNHSCARRAAGEIVCWGLPFESDTQPPSPFIVSGIDDALQMSAGLYRTCTRRPNGDIVCWPNAITKAAHVYLDAPALDITVGADRACAALTNGEVWCWIEMTPMRLNDL